MSLIKSIEHLNPKSIDNYIPRHYTYLNWAVKEGNLRAIDTLLKGGINPNGISSIGLSRSIPMTVIDFRSSDFKTIVRMLLKRGADINGEDLEGHTILTKCTLFFLEKENYLNVNFFDLFTFLLERGANTNGTIFHNPLRMIVIGMLDIPREDRDIFFYLSELFLSYNANPKWTTIEFHQFTPHIKSNAVLALEDYDKKSSGYKIFNKLFNMSIQEVITDCKSDIILESLSKYYKIPFKTDGIDGSEKAKKSLCKCIDSISKNKKHYDEDKFSELRSFSNRRGKKCSNEDLLIGADIDSFTEDELIYLDENKPDLRYCFHVSEIPMLLQSQKNPFNNKTLSEEFIESLVTKYKYFVPKTLEESLESLFVFKETKLDSGTLLDKLSDYVKTFNTYMQPEKIKEIEVPDLIEIQNMIYQGNRDLIVTSTLPTDRVAIIGESPIQTKNRILDRTITHIFIYLKKNDGSLPLLSNIIDQLLKDTSTAKEIMSLFPLIRRNPTKEFIKVMPSFDSFKKNFYRGVSYSPAEMGLILGDRKFINSLTDDQKETISYIEYRDVIEIYRRYIFETIELLLRSRFGDISLNSAWNDIIPSVIRSS